MTGRDLTPYPLAEALDALAGRQRGVVVMTMSEGQWDGWLAAAYAEDCILLELDADEQPVRAYRQAARIDPQVDLNRPDSGRRADGDA